MITPMIVASRMEHQTATQSFGRGMQTHPATQGRAGKAIKPGKPFYELGIDEQIKRASVIALARYERASDGEMKAVIKEFLKKEPNVQIYYKVGDEYAPSSYYPGGKTVYGDGVVIFFTGSPATMQLSMTYSGDRIHGLGDIPIELFKEKCAKPDG